ncbi:MAG: calcium-binding protein, partial [Candidatus Thiodiazotropha sp.]
MFSLIDRYLETSNEFPYAQIRGAGVVDMTWAKMLNPELEAARIRFDSDVFLNDNIEPIAETLLTVAQLFINAGNEADYGYIQAAEALFDLLKDAFGDLEPQFLGLEDPQAISLSAALMVAVDAGMTDEKMTRLLDAASLGGTDGVLGQIRNLEWITRNLQKAMTGTDPGEFTDQEALYQAATNLLNSFSANASANNQLIDLSQLTADEIESTATQNTILGRAYRYAMVNLQPFAILQNSGEQVAPDARSEDYDLDKFSQQYLEDRALFLNTLNRFYLTDASVNANRIIEFQDVETDQLIMTQCAGDHISQRYYFGDDQANNYAGGADNDHLYGGDGNDSLSGAAGDDYLEGNEGIDSLLGGDGDDALYGGEGIDVIRGGNDRDLLVGGVGQDHLYGGSENDNLYGDNRYFDDELNRYVLVDDKVSDRLEGGAGDDLYYAGAGDIINDSDGLGSVCMNITTNNGEETYVFLGLHPLEEIADNVYEEYNPYYDSTVRYTYNGSTLTVTDTRNAANTITIENFSDTNLGINIGAEFNPPLWRDYEDAGYWWNFRLYEAQAAYDVPWVTATNLFEDAIRLVPRFYPISWERVIGNNPAILEGTDLDDPITGSERDDEIDGGWGDDLLFGENGNDWLNGSEGNDSLDGGDGSDRLYGDSGNDTLDGGDGADRLYGGDGDDILHASDGDLLNGGNGNDRYLYTLGDGDLLIHNQSLDTESEDVLELLGGIAVEDVALSRVERSLVLSIRDGEGSITIGGFFDYDQTRFVLDAIEFSDGTRWDRSWFLEWTAQTGNGDDELIGTDAADQIDGNGGDDHIYGAAGDDTLTGGGGNDWIYGEGGNDQLSSGEGYDYLWGGAGNDHLSGNGGYGYDELHGGVGNDRIECHHGVSYGNQGDDTYIHTAGQGSVLIYNDDNRIGGDSDYIAGSGFDQLFLHGVSSSDVMLRRGESMSAFGRNVIPGLEIKYQVDGEFERVILGHYFSGDGNGYGTLDSIVFDDGTTWSYDDINAMVNAATENNDNLYASQSGDTLHGLGGNDNLNGGDGDDQLYGDAGRDTLTGGDGADVLSGGSDNDRMFGGRGSDLYLYNQGDGDDQIFDSAFNDSGDINTIRLGEGLTRENLRFRPVQPDNRIHYVDLDYPELPGQSLLIEVLGTGETLFINNYFLGYMTPEASDVRNNLYTIEFADGSTISRDEIIALATDATSESDHYLGDNSNNTAELQAGDDYANGGAGNDQLSGEAGDDYLYGQAGDDRLDGGEGVDTLWGGEGNDVLVGGHGNDLLHGSNGTDELYGDAGDDELYGGDGDDLLNGGPGSDQLSGGEGNDIYRFGFGHGQCVIDNENDTLGAHHDEIHFTDGVTPSDVVLTQEGFNLVVTLTRTGDRITVTDNFLDGAMGRFAIDAIVFLDGTVWDAQTLSDQLLQPSTGDDLLYADINGSEIDGQAGDDTLIGAEGNDQLSGGAGNDTLDGGAG